MRILLFCLAVIVVADSAFAQQPPYEISLPADPPYYRVRYEGSEKTGELVYPVSFTLWVPPEL